MFSENLMAARCTVYGLRQFASLSASEVGSDCGVTRSIKATEFGAIFISS